MIKSSQKATVVVWCLLAAMVVLSPSSAAAFAAECGDGSVPVGVWPNCEPCAGGGAGKVVEDTLKNHSIVLDETVEPTAYDYVEKCLAGLKKVFFIDFGLPSLDEILGKLCEIVRRNSAEWLDKVNKNIHLNGPYGLGSVSGGIGNSSKPGIVVKDTSRQAIEAAKRCL